MRVAIVCDWLTGTGGAERVVLELHRMFPDAPIYTSQYDSNPKNWHGDNWFKNADVRTLWLQKLPKSLKKFLPALRARAFCNLDLSAYDLVISSSGAEAKAVKTGPNTAHVCYCHSPTHYYWSRYDDYMKHPGFGILDPLARLGLKMLVGRLRRLDEQAAQRPDHFIANSNHTKEQIKKYYGRDAAVIHPPVDTARFKSVRASNRQGFVITGRQTPYKRVDLAVVACSQLDLPLKVIGSGPDHKRLVKLAGPRVSFLTSVSDKELPWHLGQAAGFIFPAEDDFGIAAVEALAAGTPVIALKKGGALDYIDEGKTGILFDHQSVESLSGVLVKFDPKKFDPARLRRKAEGFSPEVFRRSIRKFIDGLSP